MLSPTPFETIAEADGSKGSDEGFAPEVEALLRGNRAVPKFMPLPRSAERTRLQSVHSSFTTDDEYKTVGGGSNSSSQQRYRTSTADYRTGSARGRRPTATAELTSDEIDPLQLHGCVARRCRYTWQLANDALSCLRRCYFAEETPAQDRYVKPVPLMIQHRYYPHVVDRESTLEFLLPPSIVHEQQPALEPDSHRSRTRTLSFHVKVLSCCW